MQVSLRSKPIFDLLSSLSLNGLRYKIVKLIPILLRKQPRTILLWSSGSMGTTLMLAWNPKLVGATLIGIGLMRFVYWVQTTNWQSSCLYWYQFFNSPQGKLAIAVITGGFGTISSYMAFYIWSNAENQWLATALILQGFGTFLILGLLGWQIFDLLRRKQGNQYREWVSQLSDVNDLKRLIAVENLSNFLQQQKLTPTQNKQVSTYFHLMLKQEKNAMIRQAILKGCQFSTQM